MNAFKAWLAAPATPGAVSSPQDRPKSGPKVKRSDLRQQRSETHFAAARAKAGGDPKARADVEKAAVWARIRRLPADERDQAWRRLSRLLQDFARDL